MTLRDRLSACWFEVSGRRRRLTERLAFHERERILAEGFRAYYARKLEEAVRRKQRRVHLLQAVKDWTNHLIRQEAEAARLRAELQQKGAR